jgi:tRNA 2-thiouridine synthesizing protein A
MKKIEVNAKGLACPQPVVMTKNALGEIEEGEVMVTVDGELARENVKRMAENEGCSVSVEDQDDDIYALHITKVGSAAISQEPVAEKQLTQEPLVYLFDADFIGSNRELGKVLVNGFLNAIPSLPKRKSIIILISNGVKLATSGSYVLDTLKKFEEMGFTILICGTCLDFFKIREKVEVGTISNALEIMEALTTAAKVVKF